MRKTLDVGHLDTIAFGVKDPIFWSIGLLMVLEGMMFLLLGVNLIYVRPRYQPFPPVGMGMAAPLLGLAGVVVLLVSAIPTHLANKAAERRDLRGCRLHVGLTTALSVVFVVLRGFELAALPFGWDAHAYGSVVWMLLGMHFAHGIAGLIEDGALFGLLAWGTVEKKHFADVYAGGLYYYFVVASGAAIWVFLYSGVIW